MGYDDVINKLAGDPRFTQIMDELTQMVKDEYTVFDAIEFVGTAAGGLVKATYCYGKGGFSAVEVDPYAATDMVFTCNALPTALNDAMSKYNAEYTKLQERILAKQTEMYQRMLDLAYDAAGVPKASPVAKAEPIPVTKKPKTYLN
jgi:DNA-binding protein YbaB